MEEIVETSLNSGPNWSIFHLNFKVDKDCRNAVKNNLKLSKTRRRGFLLLNVFLDKCSDDIFIEDCSLWFQFAVDSVSEYDSYKKPFVFEIVTKIVLQLKYLPEALKSISPLSINKLLDALCDRKSVSLASLKCLDAYLTTFASQCGNKKYQIKQFIIDVVCIVSSDENSILKKCFAKLVTCGNAGHLSIHYQNEWINQLNCCISSLYQLLSVYDLAGKVKQLPPLSPNIEKGDMVFELISGNATNRCLKTLLQFEFMCGVIRKMLKLPFQANVKINIAEMLNLITSTFSVSYTTLRESPSVDASILLTVLPSIQASALRLLKSLIQACHNDLSSQSRLVNQLLLQVLETTVTKDFSQKSVSILRNVCYDTFYVWFSSCGLIASFDDKMTKRFLKQFKNEFETNYGLELKNSKSVRQQRGVSLNVQQQCNDVKTSCLKALNAYVINSCITMNEQHYTSISSFIINEILRIYQNDLYSQTNLYDSCREALLSVLRSLVVNHPQSAFPPLNIAVAVFSKVLNLEMNTSIKLFCTETLSIFQNVINPVMPIRQVELAEPASVNSFQSDHQDFECGREKQTLENEIVDAFKPADQVQIDERDMCDKSGSSPKSQENNESIATQMKTVNDKYKRSDCEESKSESEEDSESEVEIIEEKQKQCNDDNVNGDVHDCPVVKEKRQLDENSENNIKKLKSDACVSEEVENLLLDFVDIPASNQ